MAKNYDVYNYRMPGFRASDVQLSFSNLKAEAEGLSSLQKRIGAVTNFAIEKMGERAIEEGQKFAIQNSPTVEQFLLANEEERKRIIGDGDTTFDKSAKATTLSFVTNELYGSAITEIARDESAALDNVGQTNSTDYLTKLQNLKEGYVETLMEIDPEMAIQLDAKITTKANTSYIKILQKEQEILDAAVKVDATSVVTTILDDVGSYLEAPMTIAGKTVSFNEFVRIKEIELNNTLNANFQSFTITERKDYLIAFDQKVIDTKKIPFERFMQKHPEMSVELRLLLSNDTLELFDVERNENGAYIVPEGESAEIYQDAMTLEMIWNESSIEDKRDLFDMEAVANNLNDIAQDSEAIITEANNKSISGAKTNALIAVANNNSSDFDSAINVLKVLDPDAAKTYSDLLRNSRDTFATTSSTDAKNEILLLSLNQEITTDLLAKYLNPNTNDNGYVLNGTDLKTLNDYRITRLDKTKDRAIEYLNVKMLKGFDPRSGAKIESSEEAKLQYYEEALIDIMNLDSSELTMANYSTVVDSKVKEVTKVFETDNRSKFVLNLSSYPALVGLSFKGITFPPFYKINSQNVGPLKEMIRSVNAVRNTPDKYENPNFYPPQLRGLTKTDLTNISLTLGTYQPSMDNGEIGLEQKEYVDNMIAPTIANKDTEENKLVFGDGEVFTLIQTGENFDDLNKQFYGE